MKIFLYTVLFSILLTSSGCYTSKFLVEEPEAYKIKKDETVKIDSLLMKNGTVIKLVDFDVVYQKIYKGVENVFVCTTSKDESANQLFYKEKVKEEKVIPLNEINKIFAERKKMNVTGTVLFVTGLTLTVLTVLFILLLSLSFSHGFRVG